MGLGKWNRRTLIAGILLVAFASRGLIPPGFMPAGGRPFSLEICREGLPDDALAQGDMASMHMDHMPADSTSPRTPSHSDHCVFGSACSAGPTPHLALPGIFSSSRQLRVVAFASIAVDVRVVHLPPPRAPPFRLS
jgi:hypothetical protein